MLFFLYSVFRIVFLTILVCGCLTHWHWKASLISHLSVVLPFNPFSSLGELLTSDYQITTWLNSAYQSDFEDSKSGIYRELWIKKFKNKNKSLTTMEEAMSNTLNGHYTFYMDINSARSLPQINECKLNIMKLKGISNLIAFPFPKDSPFLGVFNTMLQKMSESGEMERMIERHAISDPECVTEKGKPLGFENIAVMFVIIIVGVLASVFLCFLEWIMGYNDNQAQCLKLRAKLTPVNQLLSSPANEKEKKGNTKNDIGYQTGYQEGYQAGFQACQALHTNT